ncbi:single-stranded DNA-binding protein [Streptomyces varsoviensis]|uniref:Single-stranded DNA-binding protein n=1 Tax=Streptomyces varsoviensis TaxID=67373 RepID=A0ABR5JAQ8_9ACTN|nr:single-stranded DNA-binding protein [Streptomyces varsoviensis]KOG90494.1 single-stranded DNA-binding protein [Streptomyces varsoviensis]
MNEALVTVVGNVATAPDFKQAASGAPVSRFRLASTVRRFDRGRGEWVDGSTSFYTVWAWRSLASNVVASISVGEPLVVQGKLRIQQGERDGKRWLSADIEAVAIGHDLARGTSAFRRVVPGKTLRVERNGSADEREPAVPGAAADAVTALIADVRSEGLPRAIPDEMPEMAEQANEPNWSTEPVVTGVGAASTSV